MISFDIRLSLIYFTYCDNSPGTSMLLQVALLLLFSHSVVSDSLPPHGLKSTKLLCPWDFPGESTGASCHFLLQGIFTTQGLNPCLLLGRMILYHCTTWDKVALCHSFFLLSNTLLCVCKTQFFFFSTSFWCKTMWIYYKYAYISSFLSLPSTHSSAIPPL